MGIKFYSCFVRFGKQGNIFIKEITANAKRRSEDKLVTKFKVYESVSCYISQQTYYLDNWIVLTVLVFIDVVWTANLNLIDEWAVTVIKGEIFKFSFGGPNK